MKTTEGREMTPSIRDFQIKKESIALVSRGSRGSRAGLFHSRKSFKNQGF
jgi:hypothetical protein